MSTKIFHKLYIKPESHRPQDANLSSGWVAGPCSLSYILPTFQEGTLQATGLLCIMGNSNWVYKWSYYSHDRVVITFPAVMTPNPTFDDP